MGRGERKRRRRAGPLRFDGLKRERDGVGPKRVSWAGAGEKGGGDGLGRAGCWARTEGKEVGRWVGAGLGRVRGIGLGFWVGSSFSISIPFQTQLFEFKLKFEFKPYALKQIKQCTSMNAHTF